MSDARQHERLARLRTDELVSVLNGCMIGLAECRADCQQFAEKIAAVAEELLGRCGRGRAAPPAAEPLSQDVKGVREKGRSHDHSTVHRAGLRPAGQGDGFTVSQALRRIKTDLSKGQ
jgi:hypothetical protein